MMIQYHTKVDSDRRVNTTRNSDLWQRYFGFWLFSADAPKWEESVQTRAWLDANRCVTDTPIYPMWNRWFRYAAIWVVSFGNNTCLFTAICCHGGSG